MQPFADIQNLYSSIQLIVESFFPYLDDIMIFSDTKLDHDKILCKVLNLLQENNVDINFKKCEFYKYTIHCREATNLVNLFFRLKE